MAGLFPSGHDALVRALMERRRDDERKRVAWSRAFVVPGYDPTVWRRDEYRSWIRFADYGDRGSAYGWEVDHVIPLARGGTDIDSNLRALHWRANASLGGLLGRR